MTADRGRLIALEGPDGIGKTTLAQALAGITYEQACTEGASPFGLVFVPRRQISVTSPYAHQLMSQLATMLWHSGDSPDLPDGFWVTLQASWYTALRTMVLEPLLAAGHDVIMDGWWFKFFSKLLVQGWAQADLDVIFSRVPPPDGVIVLTADLGALYDRKQDFQPREMGMHAGVSDYGRTAFVTYQQNGLKNLLGYADHHRWSVVELDVTASLPDTVARLKPLVDQLLDTEGDPS
ncbi:hypothetical protein [Streptomyces brasiliscabiei]|uniref:hypothetical protein n=1 Tax=Streptomyces brasiliscabiei TaxID=2736302 RepID=UPI001C116E5D|nr:hypothetical protein [Streptomyces brasiliscabiei]